jgi:nucleoside-diphosphate-sugar epimerase
VTRLRLIAAKVQHLKYRLAMKIAVTGATGFLGKRVIQKLQEHGHETVQLVRQPTADLAIPFSLGSQTPKGEDFLRLGIEGLVHCAWDFSARTFEHSLRVNVAGTKKLVDAAISGGVKQFLFISTMSAFENCESIYGQSKLAAEHIFTSIGGVVLRPGLIWGDNPGGMVGTLSALATKATVIPMIGSGRDVLYLVHEDDLTELIAMGIGNPKLPQIPYLTAAALQAVSFREILQTLAKRAHNSPLLVPIPWRIIFLGLKLLELLWIKLPIRSDSVIGLIKSNPNVIFHQDILKHTGFLGFRKFL